MKALNYFLPGFILILLLSSCNPTDLSPDKKATLYNISYGPKWRNTLDIALPADRSVDSTRVVIFIHGGAWVMGDKMVYHQEMEQFADAGIAAVCINYSFVSDLFQVHHPACPNDVRLAIDFLVSKSEDWHISPNRFGIVGHSAGGHLSLFTAYQLNFDHRIKACSAWAGPIDFTDNDQLNILGAHELFKTYMGLSLSTPSDSLAYRQASPYWVVNANSVPTQLIYGTNDIGVPYSNGIKMKNKLEALGVEHQFIGLDGADHIWFGPYLTTARNQTLQWFKQNL